MDNQVFGTYLHGIFESSEACGAILQWAGLTEAEGVDFDQIREEGINRVADAIEENLDLKKLGINF
jgi:adenosylcobyric acid synthase